MASATAVLTCWAIILLGGATVSILETSKRSTPLGSAQALIAPSAHAVPHLRVRKGGMGWDVCVFVCVVVGPGRVSRYACEMYALSTSRASSATYCYICVRCVSFKKWYMCCTH